MNTWILPLALLSLVGCAELTTQPASQPATQPDCPPAETALNPKGWELIPAANYSATQTGDTVRIFAAGEHPTAGYATKIFMSPLRIWPPQFLLYRKPPEGMAAQVITPFDVCVSFKSNRPVPPLVLTDGAGRHEVQVVQTP